MRDCKLLNHMRIRRRLKCGGCSGQCGCKTKVIPAVVTVDHVHRHEARQFLRGWCRRQRDARVVNFLLMELVKAIRCGNCQETECTDEIGCPVGLGTIVEARKFFRAGCRTSLEGPPKISGTPFAPLKRLVYQPRLPAPRIPSMNRTISKPN
jgi:hypothetical protein